MDDQVSPDFPAENDQDSADQADQDPQATIGSDRSMLNDSKSASDNEDEDDSSNEPQLATQLAFSCDVRHNWRILGMVISVDQKECRVLFGNDQFAMVRKPTKGVLYKHYGEIVPGSPVQMCKSRQIDANGVSHVEFRLVITELDDGLNTGTTVPVLRGTVVSTGSTPRNGSPVLVRATINSLGTMIDLKIATKRQIPVGTVLNFMPDIDECGDISCRHEITENDLTFVPFVAKQDYRHMVTRADLVPGFAQPDEKLQLFLRDRFGLNAAPFMSPHLSCFVYSGGYKFTEDVADFLAISMQKRGKSLKLDRPRALEIPMVKLEEYLIKTAVFALNAEASNTEVQMNLDKGMKALFCPETDMLPAFAKMVQQNCKQAEQTGTRLQMAVLVCVDADCTINSLYNSYVCPLLEAKKFPVRAVTLIRGPAVLHKFCEKSCLMTPCADMMVDKQLMLVELDSELTLGVLPKPTAVDWAQLEPDELTLPVTRKHVVLVAIPANDQRADALINSGSASYVKTLQDGKLDVLAIPFDTAEAARKLVLTTANSPHDTFAFMKSVLHSCKANVLTLTCRCAVAAKDLYQLLDAQCVFPMGGYRYRFVTLSDPMTVAETLYKYNRYMKNEKNKFRVLRNDRDEFVELHKKPPRKFVRCFRRRVPRVSKGPGPNMQHRTWFVMSNIPSDVNETQLRAVLKTKWSKLDLIMINRSTFHPTVWLSCADPSGNGELAKEQVVHFGMHPCVIQQTWEDAPTCLVDLGSKLIQPNDMVREQEITDILAQTDACGTLEYVNAVQDIMKAQYGSRKPGSKAAGPAGRRSASADELPETARKPKPSHRPPRQTPAKPVHTEYTGPNEEWHQMQIEEDDLEAERAMNHERKHEGTKSDKSEWRTAKPRSVRRRRQSRKNDGNYRMAKIKTPQRNPMGSTNTKATVVGPPARGKLGDIRSHVVTPSTSADVESNTAASSRSPTGPTASASPKAVLPSSSKEGKGTEARGLKRATREDDSGSDGQDLDRQKKSRSRVTAAHDHMITGNKDGTDVL